MFGAVVAGLMGVASPVHAAEITFIESLANGSNGVAGMIGASDPVVSPDGRFVYVSSYASNAVAVFARNRITGALSYASTVTGITNAFSVDVSTDGRHLYVASPGGTIVALSRDEQTGALSSIGSYSAVGVSGFVSVTVSPDGRSVYGVGGSPSGVAVWSRNSQTGVLTLVEQHADNVDGNLLGQYFGPVTSPINNIVVSRDGAFLYLTSTVDNAVSVYARDAATSALTLLSTLVDGQDGVDGIEGASSMVASPDERFLYVSGQSEHAVAVFQRDAITGALTYVGVRRDGQDGITTMAGARSLGVSPDGRYLYVSAITSDAINVFNRDLVTGELSFAMAAVNASNGVTGLGGVSGLTTDPLSQNLYAAGQLNNAIAAFMLPVPSVVLSQAALTVDEAGAAAVLDAGLTVLDADDPVLASGRVLFESGFVAGDVLSVTANGSITASYDSITGVLTLTGVDTLANYEAVLRTAQIQAGPDPDLDSGDTRTKAVAFEVFDGQNTSAKSVVTVTVNGYNAPSSYTVQYTAAANGSIVGAASQTVAAGGSGTPVSALADTGYHFVQWDDGSTSAARTETNVLANLAFTASFAINSYALTGASSGGGSVSPASIDVTHGGSTSFSINPALGYGIASVSGCGGQLSGNTYTTGAVTSTCAVTASFVRNQYTVAASAGEGGSISPASASVAHGETTSFTLTPNVGYGIASVSGCGGQLSGNTYTTAAITSACAIAASFGIVRPIFTPANPEAIDVKAHSLLTELPSNAAPVAVDRDGHPLEVTLVGGQVRYAPGLHVLTWRAVDSSGAAATVEQTLRVWPTVAMGKDIKLGFTKHNSGSFRVALNGLSPVYPFAVSYTVEGDPSGHDLQSGVVVFESGETEKEVLFAVLEDAAAGAAARALDVELDASLNRAERHRLRVQLETANSAPVVTLRAEQQGERRPVFARAGGVIALQALVEDPDPQDTHRLDWSYPSGATVTTQGNRLTLEPGSLAVGTYRIEVVATENGAGSLASRGTLDIVIAAQAPSLPEGASGWLESGLPDHGDFAPVGRNVLPEQRGVLDEYLIEADAGVQLSLGAFARAANDFQSRVMLKDVIPADSVTNVGGYYDFAISDLPVPGASVNVVIPQTQAIPANSVYRKFVAGQWRNFAEGGADTVASARGSAGLCPPPQSDQFRPGLNVGDWCVRLTISDGGANDADGQVNGSVLDPGGVGVISSVTVTGKSSGGGSFDWVLLLAACGLLAYRSRRGFAALLVLASATASAGDVPYWYAGVSLAQARSGVSDSDVAAALQESGDPLTVRIDDRERFAWQIRGGYQWKPYVGFELGYADLGEVSTRISGTASDPSATIAELHRVHPRSPSGVEMSLVARLPLSTKAALTARGGGWYWESEQVLKSDSGQSSRVDAHDLDFILGLGALFDFSDRWSLHADWTSYRVESERIDVIGAGARYRF